MSIQIKKEPGSIGSIGSCGSGPASVGPLSEDTKENLGTACSSPLTPGTMKTQLASKVKLALMQAWRERWTDIQWAIQLKRLMAAYSAESVDSAEILMQQALVGSIPNSLILSYLKHSVLSQMIPFHSVLKYITNFDDFSRPYCILALLHLVETFGSKISLSPCHDSPLQLVRTMLKLLHWLVKALLTCLQKIQDNRDGGAGQERERPAGQEYFAILSNASSGICHILDRKVVRSLLQIAMADSAEDYREFEQCQMNARGTLSQVPASQLSDDIRDKVSNALSALSRIEEQQLSTEPVLEVSHSSISPSIHGLVFLEAILNTSADTQLFVDQLLAVSRLSKMSMSLVCLEIFRACFMGFLDTNDYQESLEWATFTFFKVPPILSKMKQQMPDQDIMSDVEKGFEMLLEYSYLLDQTDIKENCDILTMLVTECHKAGVLTETQKASLAQKRARMRAAYHRKKAEGSRQTRRLAVAATPSKKKILADMTPEEYRSHRAEMRRRQRAALSSQKKTAIRAKERERKQQSREAERLKRLGGAAESSTGRLRQAVYNLNHEYKSKTAQLKMTSTEYARSALNLLNPRTPEKREAIRAEQRAHPCKALFAESDHVADHDLEDELGIQLEDNPVLGASMEEEEELLPSPIHWKIQLFYCRDDISRMLPHSRYSTKHGPARVMLLTVKDTHQKFLQENGPGVVGLTLFQSLRPKNVRLLGSVPLESCLCMYCTNVRTEQRSRIHFVENPGSSSGKNLSRVIHAESTVNSILKSLDSDPAKNSETLVKVLNMLSGHSFELFRLAASCMGRMQDFVTKLIRINEFASHSNNDQPRNPIRSQLFDATFLMITSIIQQNGMEIVQPIKENEFSLVVQWSRRWLPEDDKYKNCESNGLEDQDKIDCILKMILSNSEILPFGPVANWKDLINHFPYALQEVLYAFEHKSLNLDEVKGIIEHIRKQNMKCLVLVGGTYLCSYMNLVGQHARTKPMWMLEFLTQTHTPEGKQSVHMINTIIDSIIFHILPENHPQRPARRYLLSRLRLTSEMMHETLKESFHRGWLDMASLHTLDQLLALRGPEWFCWEIVEHLIEESHIEDTSQSLAVTFALMHMDLERLTIALLHKVVPKLLTNSDPNMLTAPRGHSLTKLCVLCITATRTSKIGQKEPYVRRLRKRSIIETEFEEDLDDSDMSPSKLRKLSETQLTFSLEDFNLDIPADKEEAETFPTFVLKEPLNKALVNLFHPMNSILQLPTLTPRTWFIISFIQEAIKCGGQHTRFILQFMPPNMLNQIMRSLPGVFTNDQILRICDLSMSAGRKIAAKVICNSTQSITLFD